MPEQFGLTVQELSPSLRENLGLSEDLTGVMVSEVEPGSVAEEAGMQQKDVILEVNRWKVHDVSSYRGALQRTEKKKAVLLLIHRGESTFFLTLKAVG